VTAQIINFAKAKQQITDKNERAGQWILDHAEQTRALKYSTEAKEAPNG